MWMLLLGCAVDCEPGFEERGGHCYWVEDSSSPESLLKEALQAPLPDPLSTIARYQEWTKGGDSSCPSAVDGVWDTLGCTSDTGMEFAGKALLFWVTVPEPQTGQMAIDVALVSAATMRQGDRSLQAGGITSLDARAQEQGFLVRSAVTGDFFETPAQQPWMAQGLGQSFYADLDTATGEMELDGGISHPSADVYFDKVQVVDGCPSGPVLVHEHLAQGWTELAWECDCGTVISGPNEGLEICAPLAQRAADLDAILRQAVP